MDQSEGFTAVGEEQKGYVLDKPLPTALPEGSSPEERLTFEKWHEDNCKVRRIILASMTNEIQKQYDRLEDVPSIMLRMKDVYAVPDRHIRYAAIKAFFETNMAEGSSVHSHGVKMLSLVEKLEDLKAGLHNDTLKKSIHELLNMLVQYEATTHKSEPAVLVGETSTSKVKGKGSRRRKRKKGKGTVVIATASTGGAPPAASKGKGKGNVGGSQRSKANDVCIHCQGKGHWKRECPQLLSNPGMFVVEINMISNSASWVLDTGCGAHICNNLQMLKRSRRLSKDEMILRLGDGKAVAAEAVGSLRLVVSNHIRIDLKDCYFVPSKICYARLGHISKDRIRRLVDSKSLEIYNLDHLPTCKSCLKGKMTKKPFVGQSVIANGLLDLVHTDVCGPLSIPGRGGLSYFINFTDDHSRYGYVYLMRYKSEAFGRFKEYRLEVENQTNRKIKALRSDRGGEYLSGEFIDYLKENEILSQWTPPGTPQLNGVAERRNQTLVDMVRSMMSFTELPPFFWGYALETAAKLLNIAPSKSVPQTPYEIWHGKPASYKYLRVWGSPAYVKRLVGDNLDSRSSLCRFIGYSKETAGYYFYDPAEQKIFVSRNAVFLEKVHTDGAPVLRRSTRESRITERYGFMGLTSQLDNDPKTYGEAMSDIDSDKWFEAMKSEMDSMGSNQVWTLVNPPKGVRPVGCKWVYKRKLGADGEVTAFKARLVAKGYTQRPRVDFEETYSPVAMAKSIRILLAIAAWPDVAYALSITSRYQACTGEAHWGAVKSILKYLKRTKDMFLIYGGGELILEGYSDPSFQSDDDDAKSQWGFVFKLNGDRVAWKSSKQDTKVDSTTEAEYIAASEAAKEVVWMKNYI
ncbi:UNVERIFIED_CONTAM: Retrovirus-related Pol polyprotein from transposon TNT 1-94 [Sesamum latifolium]|uniref:Retrovirus-related Pol polyprotein from transposon TNT 1-94 n=1 Tax=Sesamum latifolium TaxID=2727402 RepID=A0AAW2XMF3_9LAMI